MTYRVLLRNDPSNGYVATAIAWPNCVVEAPTRAEALSGIQDAISELLSTSEIVNMEIPASLPEGHSPYHPGFGMFRDDPTFDEFVEEIHKYRQIHNQIVDE